LRPIEACLEALDAIHSWPEQPAVVEGTIRFHDIVQAPSAVTNEAENAELAAANSPPPAWRPPTSRNSKR
jgi:predicted metal-dependent HD superfamily phosphohydrolase